MTLIKDRGHTQLLGNSARLRHRFSATLAARMIPTKLLRCGPMLSDVWRIGLSSEDGENVQQPASEMKPSTARS